MPFCSLSPRAGLVASRQTFVRRRHLGWTASDAAGSVHQRFRDLWTRPTKTTVSKLVLVTFPEVLNQAFDVGERLTLPLPVSSLIPWKVSIRSSNCHRVSSVGDTSSIKMRILLNASVPSGSHQITASNCSQLITAFKFWVKCVRLIKQELHRSTAITVYEQFWDLCWTFGAECGTCHLSVPFCSVRFPASPLESPISRAFPACIDVR